MGIFNALDAKYCEHRVSPYSAQVLLNYLYLVRSLFSIFYLHFSVANCPPP
jgi:hypothetical protein